MLPNAPAENKCSLKKEPGLCMAYIERYYFDDKQKKCLQFIYGGCQGKF